MSHPICTRNSSNKAPSLPTSSSWFLKAKLTAIHSQWLKPSKLADLNFLLLAPPKLEEKSVFLILSSVQICRTYYFLCFVFLSLSVVVISLLVIFIFHPITIVKFLSFSKKKKGENTILFRRHLP